MMSNSKLLLNHYFIILISVIVCLVSSDQVTKKSTDQEWALLEKYKNFVNNNLMKNESNFYNYSILCGRDVDSFARVDRRVSFCDESIPEKFKGLALSTYLEDSFRSNRCPKWSANIDTTPQSGSMGNIKLPENTQIGEAVYYLSALSDEPLYYFMRLAETETDMMFDVFTEKTTSFIGRVILKEKLDYEKKKLYEYLVYAFDGANLIERLSSIEITDVDDEPPQIDTNNRNYNAYKRRFEFNVFENASVGYVLNTKNPIIFKDVDTQPTQLKISLVNNFTGLNDVPFSISVSGRITLTSSIDYESQADYLLKILVKDGSGSTAEQLVYVKIVDVPDLAPIFLLPYMNVSSTKSKQKQSEIKFFANQIGPVFDVRALSGNIEPMGEITYRIMSVTPSELKSKFELVKYDQNDTYYLNCVDKIELNNDGKDLVVKVLIRATESDIAPFQFQYQRQLNTEKLITLRIISGDMCPPLFDKETYEFNVIEGQTPILEPILVKDCDYGFNGQIFLSTTNKNFQLVIDKVYRQASLAIELKRSLDYDKQDPNDLEFYLVARGSNFSLNGYVTKAKIKITIKNVNEFTPQFIEPSTLTTKVFTYKVPENQDFHLKVRAIDEDLGKDGKLMYNIDLINMDDDFGLKSQYDSTEDCFHITVPGAYLDSRVKVPITFIVTVHDYGEPKLTNEIIVNIKAQPSYFRPPYFEFQEYGFELKESLVGSTVFKMKLINDNLNHADLTITELNDPLDLLSFQIEDMVPHGRTLSNFDEGEDEQMNAEKIMVLTVTDPKVDLDRLYIENSNSDLYYYSLQVQIANTTLSTKVGIYIRLIDDNDNQPVILNTAVGDFIEAELESTFKPNSAITLSRDIRFDDSDFSPEFGIDSLYLKVNDSRFMIDNHVIFEELEFLRTKNITGPNEISGIPLVIRCVASPDQLEAGQFVWLNVSCEDNYIYSRFNREKVLSTSLLIRVNITMPVNKSFNLPIFEKKLYEFTIDENWTGILANIRITNDLPVTYSLLSNSDYFELTNRNELKLKKQVDYDNGQRVFNITVRAVNTNDMDYYADASVLVLVNDLNDNPPTFLENEFKFALMKENLIAKGTKIGIMYAIDLDYEDMLTFSIRSANNSSKENDRLNELFDLVPINMSLSAGGNGLQGVNLVSKKEFKSNSLQTNQEMFEFNVVVRDKAFHEKSSPVQIRFVSSIDQTSQLEWSYQNDSNVYRAVLKENSPKGTFVTEVKAVINGAKLDSVKYMLLGDTNPYYTIDESTGKIYTTDIKMNKKLITPYERQKSNILLVQAIYKRGKRSQLNNSTTAEDDTVIWSPVATVEIHLEDLDDSPPIFIQPTNNRTKIIINIDSLKTNNVSIYKFKSIDPDMNDHVMYSLVSVEKVENNMLDKVSKLNIKLPFYVHRVNGSLIFRKNLLSSQDYLRTLELFDSVNLIVRLTVHSIDQYQNVATCYLFIQFGFKTFFNLYKESVSDLAQIEWRLHATSPYLKEIDSEAKKHFKKPVTDQPTYFFSLNHLATPNTEIAQIKPYLNNTSLNILPDTLVILGEPDSLKPQPIQTDQVLPQMQSPSVDPAVYFNYDPFKGSIKLIRKINNEIIRNISFYLTDPISESEWNSLSTDINSQKIKVNILVNPNPLSTDNPNGLRRLPRLGLDLSKLANNQDMNIILMDVFNVASIFPDPRLLEQYDSIKQELNKPNHFSNSNLESKASLVKMIESITTFNSTNVLGSFLILSRLDIENITVSFGDSTDKQVIDSYDCTHNGTHVLIVKKRQIEPNPEIENLYKFSIHLLADDKTSATYFGNLYVLDIKQLKRILQVKLDFIKFSGQIHRSKIVDTRVNVSPNILLVNPLPYQLQLKLENTELNKLKNVNQAKYFSIKPNVLDSLNEQATLLELSLHRSLEDDPFTAEWKRISFQLCFKTNNNYIDPLLETMSVPFELTLGVDNVYAPVIFRVFPEDLKIEINEGKYTKKKIANINAIDRDKNDAGIVQYHIIGSSLLDINESTGDVYLNGELDAESEHEIKFYCYARDLAQSPFTKQTEMIEFTILIKDIDEFKPILQPASSFILVKENEPVGGLVDNLLIDCYDKDLTANVQLDLSSIRYVYAHDVNTFVEDTRPASMRQQLKDLFRLVYFIDDESPMSSNQTKQANLKSNHLIDYEMLFRPNETLIRVDLVCSETNNEKEAKILIKIEDVNDNEPRFVNTTESVLKIDEASRFESILRVNALDMDLSAKFGNDSLVYSVVGCEPDPFRFYMDKNTGDLYSELIVDADSDELMSKRRELYNSLPSRYYESTIDLECKFKVADSYGKENTFDNSSIVLYDYINMTVRIENLNDNAPIIRTNTITDNTFEVKEGEQTRGMRLAQIAVIDKDDATGLRCLFENRLTFLDPFELKTSPDKFDPFITWCILKVRDDMFIDYDAVKLSSYLFDLLVVDEEKPPVYPNSGVSRAQMKVRVIPVNSKPPMFMNGNEQTFYTLDTARPGTVLGTILATDFENPNPDRLIYVIDDLPGNKKFELQFKASTNLYWGSVNLITKQKLDVSESPYIISVTAYDGPIGMRDTLKSRKIIKVYVLNKGSLSVWVNKDNGQPVDYYSVNIDEEQDAGSQVVRIQAIIPNLFKDSDKSNEIIYSIDTFNISNVPIQNPYFQIDNLTGLITTTMDKLDYEEKDPVKKQLMRNIKVRATSQDGFFTYQTYVSIGLQDVNDNAPRFDYSVLSKLNESLFCVLENTTQLQQVGVLHATDADSGLNGKVEYKLDEQADNYNLLKTLFEIDEISGAIFLRDGGRIDRETNTSIRMSVVAYDQGSDSKSTPITFKICVLDINDNQPQFNSSLKTKFIIEENSMIFNYKLNAADPDYGSNGTVYYYIDEANSEENLKKFYIEPLTGQLGLITWLDYEEKQSYSLTIVSSDNGLPTQLKSSIKLNIQVKDLNDNAPKFSTNLIEKTISQSVKSDETIIKMKAVDLDLSEQFNNTFYRISRVFSRQEWPLSDEDKLIKLKEFPSLFQIDLKSGELRTTSNADLNETFYLIEIEAFDQDRPELNDKCNVSLKVKTTDDNKLRPILTEKLKNQNKIILFKRNLREKIDDASQNNYVVDIVRAVDPLKQGLNYYIDTIEELNNLNNVSSLQTSQQQLFSIDMDSGVIKTTKPRSFYKSEAIYKLNVRITSKLNESLSSPGVILVQIDSTNDSLFDSNVYTVSIDENSPIKTKVFDLAKKRLKSSTQTKKILFKVNKLNSLPTQIAEKWFSLDEQTGIIETNSNEIDYEKFTEILLAIDILDDEDSDMIETITLKIEINDLNDNSPVFDLKYDYEPKVNEDTSDTLNEERLLAKFLAYDLDGSEKNSVVSYSIESVKPSSQYLSVESFKLEKISPNHDRLADTSQLNTRVEYGLFKIAGVNLDRDNKEIGDLIRITLIATDNGVPILSAEKQINLNLIDLNDNAPIIRNVKQLESISIFESQETIKPFIHVDAYDIDEGANAFIGYEIINEKTHLVNNIETKTNYVGVDKNGNLFLQANVDYEKERWIDLVLVLFGNTVGLLTTKQNIRINILNVNDNPPKFAQIPSQDNNHCQLQIDEGSWTRGAFFYQFKATDADDLNGTFEYLLSELSTINKTAESLKQANKILDTGLFQLDSSGKLSLSSMYELDREAIDNFKLLIVLKDEPMNSVQLETQLECFIQVMDINDNAPSFLPEQLEKNNTEIKVFPLMNEISAINWFAATDPDLGLNSSVEYSLQVNHNNDEFSNLFEIDSSGYLLINAQSLTKSNSLDLNDVYNLVITAKDLGKPTQLSSHLNINIKIDEKYFSLSQISIDKLDLDGPNIVRLDENPAVNKFVAKINAANSFMQQANKTNRYVDLRFKLITANETFQIDEKTGVVSIVNNSLIDYEVNKDFVLNVEAIESVGMSSDNKTRTGHLNMLVKVLNLNDNPPVFNRLSYEFSCEENIKKIPLEMFVGTNNQFIQITDRDLNQMDLMPAPNQLNPIQVRINGPDANLFRLIQLNKESIYKLEALNSFDYEKKNKYEMEIDLWDGNFRASALLLVNIIDVNDFAPKFEQTKYEFNLNENSPRNTFIGRIRAIDLDGSEKMNTVNYKILNVKVEQGPLVLNSKEWQTAMINSNDDLFVLNKETGELSVTGNSRNYRLLDRELILYFDLTVVAYNPADERNQNSLNYTNEMSDSCHVFVYLNDLNDNLPSFDQEIYFVNLREKSFSPRAIFKSTAFDLDAGENGTVKYSIESVNNRVYASQATSNEFYVDPNDCTLYLNLYVDIDSDKTSKSFDIVLVASDLGKPQQKSKATVLVNLIDVNDNKPKIVEPVNEQVYELAENNIVNSFIFKAKAFDPDYSHNPIRYQLDQDLNQDWQSFSVDNQTGQMISLISFDYETKKEYNLRIICSDQNGIMIDLPSIDAHINSIINSTALNDSANSYPLVLKSYVDVKVKITDLDDNEPEFSNANELFTRNISEILDIGSTVTFLPLAHDKDTLAQNTDICYKIVSGNDEKKFDLNEKTGELTLVDELERSLSHVYSLRIRATSKQSSLNDLIREDKNNLNKKSHLNVLLNIVKDKLFIEFEEKNYYVSIQQQQQIATDALEFRPFTSQVNLKQFQFKNLNEDPLVNSQPSENVRKLDSAAIFFGRSHLKQRKLKRKIRFSLEMLQLIRYDENIAIKMPAELLRTVQPSVKKIGSGVLNNVANIDLAPNRTSLFDVDSFTGKVYINRDLIRQNGYQVGDKFILSVVATAYAANSSSVLNFYENTVTQLTVRLTDRDYSFMMTIRNSLNNILSNHLNPLKELYIPRLLEADGVKLSIQDLVPSKLIDLTAEMNSTSVNVSEMLIDFSAQTHYYDLIMQVGTNSDHVQINLDSFVNLMKNFSNANVFTKGLDSLTSRQPIEVEHLLSDPNRNNSLYDFDKPFYMNWFFWVLLIVALMVFMILGFFVNCAYLSKHHKQQKNNTGLVIEYPPGYKPLYTDGVLSLNSKKTDSFSEREYEDQELAMNIEDDLEEDENNNH